MKVIPELPGRGQRILDVVFRVALLLLMAGIAFHTVVADLGPEVGQEQVAVSPGLQRSAQLP